ncbi:MAG: autotransporter-associated beta strand repeat-containing protein, partial [Thermoguttaceae bacterium]
MQFSIGLLHTTFCWLFARRSSSVGILILLTLAASHVHAQTLTTLASFNGSNGAWPGGFPAGSLVLSGSTLYGTTAGGGAYGDGTLFSIPVTGGNPTTLASFSGANGVGPNGSLLLSGSTFYGTTAWGGPNYNGNYSSGYGTVFSIPITGGTITTLSQFNGTNGSTPYGLALSGSTLYGVTAGGGSSGDGTVFSIRITGGTPRTLSSMTDTVGVYPTGLVVSGSAIYGVGNGGVLNDGTGYSDGSIFSVPINGGTPTALVSFNGANGSHPQGSLVLTGSTLYGVTNQGGAYINDDPTGSGYGTVFSVSTNGGNFTTLYSFNGSLDEGYGPIRGLVRSGSALYGTTGSNAPSTVFSIPINGGTPTFLSSMGTQGIGPAQLLFVGADIYGTTETGGASRTNTSSGNGTVFAIDLAPTHQWGANATGSWNTPGNWNDNTVPNGVGQQAVLGPGPTGPTTVTLDAAQTVGTLTLNSTADYTLMAGNGGSLTLDNSGNPLGIQIDVLSGAHSITAPMIIANSAARVNLSGSSSLSISGNISQAGGSQSLTLTGDGTGFVSLSGSNSYTGGTILSSGTLLAANPASLPSYGTTGAVTVASGAALFVRAGNGTTGWSGPQIDSLLATVNWNNGSTGFGIDTTNGDFTFGSSISQVASLTKLGPNTLTLTGSNTYTGLTTISAGTLQLGDGTAGHDGSVMGDIFDNATLACNLNGTESYSGRISGNGGVTKTGPGTLVLSGQATYAGPTVINAGTIMAGQGPQFMTAVLSAGGTTTPGWSSYASGPLAQGELTIVGHGTNFWGTTQMGQYAFFSVPTNNPFDVAVHIASLTTNGGLYSKAGIMARANAGNNAVTTLFSGQSSQAGVLFEENDQEINNGGGGGGAAPNWLRLTYDGKGDFEGYYYTGTSATAPASNDPLWQPILNNGSPVIYTETMPGPTFDLGIADTAYDNASTNTSVFDNLGTLLPLVPIGPQSNILPPTTALSIASGGKFDLAGGNQQVASLSDYAPGNAGSIVNSATGTKSVLTLSPTGSTTFSGTILGGGGLGTISLVISGSGTQVLSGSNTYAGNTTITAGALQAVDGIGLPSRSNLAFNGNLTDNGCGAVFQSCGVFSRTLGSGAGQVQWKSTGDGGFAANGSPLTVSMSPGVPLVWNSGNNNNGTLGFLGDLSVLTFGSPTANSQVNFTDSIDLNGPNQNGGNRQIEVAAGAGGDSALISGNIIDSAGGGGLTKTGAGLLILTGNNAYTGGTTINAGTLEATTTASLPGYNAPGSVTVNGGILAVQTRNGTVGWSSPQIDGLVANANWNNGAGALGFDTTSGDFTYGTSITQTMSLAKVGPNTLTLTGSNTYSGLTTISAGTLQLGDGTASHDGSIAGNILNNAALVYNLNGSQTYSGAIYGGGSLTKTGIGTLTLGGYNSYHGPTVISSGVLQLGAGA